MQGAENRLSNNRKRRGKRKLGRTLLILLGVLSIFSVLLLRIWLSSRAVELAYQIDKLAEEKKALEGENKNLYLEIVRLKSPDRISRIAITRLNMIRSTDAEVILLRGKSPEPLKTER